MMTYLFRRKGLGKSSCQGIVTASKQGILAYRNDESVPAHPDTLCIRWGCTATVPTKNILNKAKAIHWVSDKSGSRKALQELDPTLVPKTWFSLGDFMSDDDPFPVIVRPAKHAQGKQLWFCEDIDELEIAIIDAGKGYYISQFIDKVAEYRIFVVSNRVVCVASKKPPEDHTVIAWNVAQGGSFSNVKWSEWPREAIRKAIVAMDYSGLDFGGVDIMVDKEGESYILEINSACSLTSPYRQQCFAKAFDYIITNGKDKFPLPTEYKNLSSIIHPAIWDKQT